VAASAGTGERPAVATLSLCQSPIAMPGLRQWAGATFAQPRPNGSLPRAVGLGLRLRLGRYLRPDEHGWPISFREVSSLSRQGRGRVRGNRTGCSFSLPTASGLYDSRVRVGMVQRLVSSPLLQAPLVRAGGVARNPTGPRISFDPSERPRMNGPQRGGSFLCERDQYCTRY